MSELELLVIDRTLFGHPDSEHSDKIITENQWQPNQSPDAQVGEELSQDRRKIARVAGRVVLNEGMLRLYCGPGWAGLWYSMWPLSKRMSGFLCRYRPSALTD
jgi:hypothetical protein